MNRLSGIAGASALFAGVTASITLGLPAGASYGAVSAARTVQFAPGHYRTAGESPAASPNGNAGFIGGTPAKSKATLKIDVPTIDCSSSPPAPMFIQVFFNGTLKNTSFSGSGFDVAVSCSGTVPSYSAQMVVDDANGSTMTVAPGDILSFSGSAKPKAESYSLTDVTSSQTITGSGPGLSAQNLQLTTQGGFTGDTVFPPFTKFSYSAIRVNGASYSSLNPSGFNEVDGSGNVEIQTSALSANGKNFSLTFVTNT